MKNAFRSCTTFLVGPPFKYPSRGSDRYYWKKKKKKWGRHIFCRKWRWIMAAALEEEPDQKPIWGCLLVKNHFGNPPSPFDLLWAFRTLKLRQFQAFLPLLKQALEVRCHMCHMWEIIHRDISHASSSKSRFFFWEELFATHIDLHHGCNLLTLCSIVLKCRIAIASPPLKDFLLDWETWYLGLSTPLY